MRNLMAAMALFLLFPVAAPAAPALNWPPMTMSFLLPPPAVSALPAGTPVDFSFRQVAGGYQLTAIHASQR